MARNIQNYELYGDLLSGRAPDPIHLETISERSSKHGWKIRVHSHRHLAQIFLFRSTGVFFNVGEVQHTTTHPTFLVVHPETPHGFRFTEDVEGEVISIRFDLVPGFRLDRLAAFKIPTNAIFSEPDTPRFADIVCLVDQLHQAFHRLDNQRSEVIAALVDLILLYLVGDQSTASSPALAKSADRLGRQDILAQDFCLLLEENFRQSWAVSEYAARMGLSSSHLTRICCAVLDAPPNTLVRRRRILEAKRLLEYTRLSLSEIAHRSGFRDTAFFSRTFKSLVGVAPNAYRKNLA